MATAWSPNANTICITDPAQINDTLGHPAGDELLREFARRLSRAVRETALVARLGGDEFAILQTALLDPEDAGSLAERIAAELAAPCSRPRARPARS
jgi:diguanylate cyclase (GGDEF)-like protein